MLTGASYAQVAILVISAPEGIREQTQRHAFLLHMLGIKQVIVAINKMDLVDYQQDVFEQIKKDSGRLLSSLGFEGMNFVPISAMQGDNVYKPSAAMSWYGGPTLIQLLDEIEPKHTGEKPLRFVVQDVYQVDSERIAVGRIEAGMLAKGDELVFEPLGVTGKVSKIEDFPREVTEAKAGDCIGILVGCEVERGNVGGHLVNPPRATRKFLGEVVVLEGTLKKGDQFEIRCATKRANCLVKEIQERISSETGQVLGENVTAIAENEAGSVLFETESVVLEKFTETPELGRFILLRNGKNIGAGVVLKV